MPTLPDGAPTDRRPYFDPWLDDGAEAHVINTKTNPPKLGGTRGLMRELNFIAPKTSINVNKIMNVDVVGVVVFVLYI